MSPASEDSTAPAPGSISLMVPVPQRPPGDEGPRFGAVVADLNNMAGRAAWAAEDGAKSLSAPLLRPRSDVVMDLRSVLCSGAIVLPLPLEPSPAISTPEGCHAVAPAPAWGANWFAGEVRIGSNLSLAGPGGASIPPLPPLKYVLTSNVSPRLRGR